MEHFLEIVRKGVVMDRRQQKTRAAVFAAFSSLLAEKSYSRITVQEIIDTANIGRTTFYAHFETKDDLLKALCEVLFDHIISSATDCTHTHGLYSDKNAPESVFCHLLQHLQEDENNILELLSCESSELFLRYFKDSLNELIKRQFVGRDREKNADIPEDFLVNHISGSFVEMVLWWIRGRMKQTPEELDRYFRAVIEPVL
ncbi:TetR/AcrR family transcriptional regulator [Mordavella massiliensis]